MDGPERRSPDKRTGSCQTVQPALESPFYSGGWKNQCSAQGSRLQAQEVALRVSCGHQNPPSFARKSYKAFELLKPWTSFCTRAGEANIWVASGRVWGFLSSLLDQHVPEVPSCEHSAQTMRRRWADTKAADPRRLQRKPLAEDGKCYPGQHNPSCCNP